MQSITPFSKRLKHAFFNMVSQAFSMFGQLVLEPITYSSEWSAEEEYGKGVIEESGASGYRKRL